MLKKIIIKKVIAKLKLAKENFPENYNYEIPKIPANLQEVKSPKDAQYLKYIKNLIEHMGLDPMTGLYNKQHFEKLEKEPGAFIYIDGDGIKKINDSWGHDAGHAAIKALAAGIKAGIRGKDTTTTRFGGDEFVVHVKDISIATGVNIAKRILENIQKQKISEHYHGKEDIKKELAKATIGASLGVGKTETEADKALYKAKEKGRNRVEFYSEKEKLQ